MVHLLVLNCADSTMLNAKLSNSTITLNGNSISLGVSTFVDGELVEQTVKTADFTPLQVKVILLIQPQQQSQLHYHQVPL